MDLGTIEIRNDGTRAEPSWTVTSEMQGHLTDNNSLDDIAEWLYDTVAGGNTIDALCLDLGAEGD